MNKNIQGDFQICISVPLLFLIQKSLSLQSNQTYHTFIYNSVISIEKRRTKTKELINGILKNLLMNFV